MPSLRPVLRTDGAGFIETTQPEQISCHGWRWHAPRGRSFCSHTLSMSLTQNHQVPLKRDILGRVSSSPSSCLRNYCRLRVAKGREGLLTGGGVLGLSFIVSTWLKCVTVGQAWFWMMLFLPGIMLNDFHWNWRSSFWELTIKGSYLFQVSHLPVSSRGINDTDKPVISDWAGRRIKFRWECGC